MYRIIVRDENVIAIRIHNVQIDLKIMISILVTKRNAPNNLQLWKMNYGKIYGKYGKNSWKTMEDTSLNLYCMSIFLI